MRALHGGARGRALPHHHAGARVGGDRPRPGAGGRFGGGRAAGGLGGGGMSSDFGGFGGIGGSGNGAGGGIGSMPPTYAGVGGATRAERDAVSIDDGSSVLSRVTALFAETVLHRCHTLGTFVGGYS